MIEDEFMSKTVRKLSALGVLDATKNFKRKIRLTLKLIFLLFPWLVMIHLIYISMDYPNNIICSGIALSFTAFIFYSVLCIEETRLRILNLGAEKQVILKNITEIFSPNLFNDKLKFEYLDQVCIINKYYFGRSEYISLKSGDLITIIIDCSSNESLVKSEKLVKRYNITVN